MEGSEKGGSSQTSTVTTAPGSKRRQDLIESSRAGTRLLLMKCDSAIRDDSFGGPSFFHCVVCTSTKSPSASLSNSSPASVRDRKQRLRSRSCFIPALLLESEELGPACLMCWRTRP